MSMLSRKKSSLARMLANRPPTRAARWMTWVGWYLAKIAFVALQSRKSPSLEDSHTHLLLSPACSMAARIPWPTNPDPPVTRITLGLSVLAAAMKKKRSLGWSWFFPCFFLGNFFENIFNQTRKMAALLRRTLFPVVRRFWR